MFISFLYKHKNKKYICKQKTTGQPNTEACPGPAENFTAGIYLFKVKNRNTRTSYEICSKLAIKTPELLCICLLHSRGMEVLPEPPQHLGLCY